MHLPFPKIGYKSFILGVLHPLLDVKSEGNRLEKVSFCQLIIFFEIVKQSLFVSQVKIRGEVVVNSLPLPRYFPQTHYLLALEQLFPSVGAHRSTKELLLKIRHYLIQLFFLLKPLSLLLPFFFTF